MKSVRPWIGALLVFSAAFVVYSNSLDNGFVWDDHVQIEANAFLHDSKNAGKIFDPSFFIQVVPVRGGGRPLVLLSLFGDRAAWGDTAGGYHLTNVLLHGAASIAFYGLALECLAGGPALIAALIFAAHPIHTETVDVVSFRGDLLAAFFVFAGLWAYSRLTSKKGWGPLLAAILCLESCYFLGLMAKEMAITLPGLAILFEWVFRRPKVQSAAQRRSFWTRQALIVLIPAAMAAWYLYFRAPRAGFPPALAAGLLPSKPQWGILYESPIANFMTMSWVFAQYFSLMLFPFPLEIDRAPLIIRQWNDGWLWAAWFVLGFLGWIAITAGYRRRHPVVAFGLGWCFLSLIPVSNLVPIYNVMAERYLYLVSAGACLTLAAVVEGFSFQPAALAAATMVIGVFSGFTYVRNRQFRDDQDLFLRASRRFVDSARLHCNRGALLERDGETVAAIGEFLRALAIHPDYVEARIALGKSYDALGLPALALKSYEEGTRLKPRYAIPYFVFGEALRRAHRLSEARNAYAQALVLDPRFAMAHVGLGLYWAESHKRPEAIGEMLEAQKLQPDLSPAHFALANLFADQGRWADAAREFKRTIVLDPENIDAVARLSRCYKRMGRTEAAKRWMERARTRG